MPSIAESTQRDPTQRGRAREPGHGLTASGIADDALGPARGSPPSTTLVPPQAPAIDVSRPVKSCETLRLAWILAAIIISPGKPPPYSCLRTPSTFQQRWVPALSQSPRPAEQPLLAGAAQRSYPTDDLKRTSGVTTNVKDPSLTHTRLNTRILTSNGLTEVGLAAESFTRLVSRAF